MNSSTTINQTRITPFDQLLIWNDIHPHSGEYNMAVDELLLEQAFQTNLPILRFYHWNTPTISLGYFHSLIEAKSAFGHATPHVHSETTPHIIRRWTGGGIVNHSDDHTYTLAIPPTHPLAAMRGAKTYQAIHQALALALQAQDIPCSLATNHQSPTSAACFTNPVPHDILSPSGKKLAGAGQKRTRHGLLHQASVIDIKKPQLWQRDLAKHLASTTSVWQPSHSFLKAALSLAENKYATKQWLQKR